MMWEMIVKHFLWQRKTNKINGSMTAFSKFVRAFHDKRFILFNVCNGFMMRQAGQLADKFRNFLAAATRKKPGKSGKSGPTVRPRCVPCGAKMMRLGR
jgi:hypothetical protein